MSELEFLDLFPNSNPRNNGATYDDYSDFHYSEGAPLSNERMHINDYKSDYKNSNHNLRRNTNNAPNRQTNPAPRPAAETAAPRKPLKALNLSDEKIIWAGALFVFFGVFVFLIGLWLGKTTTKDVRTENDKYIAELQDKLSQMRVANSPDVKPGSVAVNENYSINPAPISAPEQVTPAYDASKPITSPPVQEPAPKPKAETKTVKSAESAKPAVAEKPKTVADIKGDYTIQVSAHTSMEKARSAEGQLRAAGYQAYIVESFVNGTRYFRVRVGKFDGKNAAKEALAKIKSLAAGRDAILINLN